MASFDGLHTPLHAGGPEPGRGGLPSSEAPFGQDIAAERRQLEAERAACERKLDQLKSDIDSNDHALAWSRGEAERDVQAKLHFLASVSPDLRTPLHTMLGYAELLRRDGGLNPVQSTRLNAMLEAGLHLLDRVNCVLTLSEADEPLPALERGASQQAIQEEPRGKGGAADDGANGAAPVASLRVLVVDDMAMNRDIASAFLTSAGHHVTVAEDGPQAVLAASGADFDVVLMDVRMPGMDGLEATRQIRGLGRGRGQMPIVALTALAFVEQVADCRLAGMNGHLAKPFSPDTLCRAIALAAAGEPGAAPHLPVVSLAAFKRGWTSPAAAAGGRRQAGAGDGAFSGPAGGQAGGEVVGSGAPAGTGQGWCEIVGPWSRPASAAALAGPDTARRRASDTAFVLKMASVASKWGRRLVDGKLSCEPPPNHILCEFHWLLFAQSAAEVPQGFNAACDLWRWNGTNWRSVTVPGAQFSADELYDQGWRYCGPCADKIVRVEIVTGGFARDPGAAPEH